MGPGCGEAVAILIPPGHAVMLAVDVEDGDVAFLAGTDAYQDESELSVHRPNAFGFGGSCQVSARAAWHLIAGHRKDCPTAGSTFQRVFKR
jgi:hypothetical protein